MSLKLDPRQQNGEGPLACPDHIDGLLKAEYGADELDPEYWKQMKDCFECRKLQIAEAEGEENLRRFLKSETD